MFTVSPSQLYTVAYITLQCMMAYNIPMYDNILHCKLYCQKHIELHAKQHLKLQCFIAIYITVHCSILHYIVRYHIALQCIIAYCITVYYSILHYSVLQQITFKCINDKLHFKHNTQHCIKAYHITMSTVAYYITIKYNI